MINDIITNISWDNAKLKLTLELLKEGDYYLQSSSNLNKKYAMKKEQNNILEINFTNVNGTMVDEDEYYIVYYENDVRYLLTITIDCAENYQDYDRLFPYGLNNYIYTIRFQPFENNNLLMLKINTGFFMKNKKPKKRNYYCESKNIFQFLIKFINHLAEKTISLIFQLFLLFRKRNNNNILLMSETRSPISGNLKALDQCIKENYSNDFNIKYHFSKSLDKKRALLFFDWIPLCWKIAGCSYVFVDDYSPLLKFINFNKKIKLIQLWHAGVGFKAVGYARFGREGSPYPYNSGHRKYDYVVVGAEGLISVYSEVFGISEEKCLPYGLPRLDGYNENDKINEFKSLFYKKYPELLNKKIILFAPTYRGATQKEAYYPYDKIDLSVINTLGENGYVFCLKMHPFVKEKFLVPTGFERIIYDFSDWADINELFYVTDILITDYSSNIYEYALMRKPLVFYAYDYDVYKLTRGMQTDLKKIEFGNIVFNFNEIESIILNKQFKMDGLDLYLQKYHQANNDYSAAKRIIQKILRGE